MSLLPKKINLQDAYNELPNKLYSAHGVREMDRIAIEDYDINGFDLMYRAARFSFHTLYKKWPHIKKLIILCGSGNNAGDGYLIAEIAKKRNVEVDVFFASDPMKLKGDALSAYKVCIQSGIEPLLFSDSLFAQACLEENCVIVDALLGTGLNTEVQGLYAQIIHHANDTPIPKVAIDIPSGLCSTTGQILGIAINASLTATFIGLKLGLFTGSGRQHAGEITFSNLELTEISFECISPLADMLLISSLLKMLTPRDRSAHKGTYGHAVIIGGDLGFGGAIHLPAQACARMGAGLTTVITQESHRSSLLACLPEAMIETSQNLQKIEATLQKASVIIIGPGLGQSAWSEKMLFAALSSGKQMILDADAINLLCQSSALKQLLTCSSHQHIFTPHPGEAARMLNIDTKEIQKDRINALKEIKRSWGGNILLKGSGSLIYSNDGTISLCPYGNPGMASGGMGDVLSGLIGGLLAQSLPPDFSLKLGVVIHAKAADILAEEYGERGLLASDIIPIARHLLNNK